jgi:hypothetical protein
MIYDLRDDDDDDDDDDVCKIKACSRCNVLIIKLYVSIGNFVGCNKRHSTTQNKYVNQK